MAQESKEELKNRLREALDAANMKPSQLSEITGIPKSMLSYYLNGRTKPKADRIYKISKALNVSEAWLLGYDVPKQKSFENTTRDKLSPEVYDCILPIEVKRFPLLGEIACGKPILANEDKELYVEAGANIQADFCLRAKGDSMIGARICDGDIVFIQQRDMVDDGEIAAVIIEDEVTLKRLNYYPGKNLLILKPENTKYEDLVYTGEELDHIRILGRAVAFQSDIR